MNADKSTVYRIVRRFLNTGCVAKSSYPMEKAARRLTEPVKLLILQLLQVWNSRADAENIIDPDWYW